MAATDLIARREARRDELLALAEGVFARRGYAASMDDVAAAAGVTKPVVYRHFASKDELYLAVLRRARAQLTATVLAATAEGTPQARLQAGLEAFLDFAHEHFAAWAVLFAESPFPDELEALLDAQREVVAGLVAAELERAGAHATPERIAVFAVGLVGSAQHLARWWRRHPALSREDVAGPFVAAAWGGLSALLDPERAEA